MNRFESIICALLARLRVHHIPRQVPAPPAHPSPDSTARNLYRIAPTRWGLTETPGAPPQTFSYLDSPHLLDRERRARNGTEDDSHRPSLGRTPMRVRAEPLARFLPIPRGLLGCKPPKTSIPR